MTTPANEQNSVSNNPTDARQPEAKPSSPLAAVTRAYLKCLRAAEMATWEITGGDYVLARFKTTSLRDRMGTSSNGRVIFRRRTPKMFLEASCRF